MKRHRTHLMVCAGTGCVSNKSFKIKETLEKQIKRFNLEDEVLIAEIGCIGVCAQGPIMIVQPDGIFYQLLTEEDIPHLVEEHLLKGRPVKRLMYTPSEREEPIPKMSDIGFFSKQRLIALRNRGLIDPEKIDEYIARDGYKALAKALTSMSPKKIIKEIKDSGLRGRGGAGFPTGLKWEICRNAKDNPKYIICNADEGDPGAYMDRCIIESDPHSVLEGMMIGARAMGSSHGFIYIRNEYPLALQRLIKAIEQAREYGLFGKNILGCEFDFDITVHRGAGAFVCGEETALMACIEGKVGRPRPRPPYPAEKGLWGKPTNINNVETWANVSPIILRSSKWFSKIGTKTSKGTKVFSLVGNINNTGLIEVPMGITLSEIIYDIGGGIPGNKRFKAAQTGGPSGGCIPADLIDLHVDYEELTKVGSMMGSGGMVVMDEDTCMVNVAKYFLSFTMDESCGKCTPCREGNARLLEILTRICKGEGREGDIELLEELSKGIIDGSLCALGGSSPNPVLTTIKYFRDEYEQHIKYKRCPATVCKKIIFTPCKYNCPIDTDVPAFVALIAHGRYQEAFEVIRKENPFPIVCGYVCHHPCEDRCRSGEVGDPIAIKAMKRFVGEYQLKRGIKPMMQAKQPKLEKVAIIGAGPAGLAAGYDLANLGYDVTVFDSSPILGGMLAAAIPHFRLPKEMLNIEINLIKKAGIKIETNTYIGRDISIDDLFKQEYKAIFIATGAHKSLRLDIPGEDVEGVIDALEFLKAVNSGKKVKIGDVVAVIGGGNAAIDAARAAWRVGCKKVSIIYRRTKAEMPAIKTEIEAGIEEGIDLQILITPTRVLSKKGKLKAIECICMRLGDFDATGRRRPVPIEGSEFTIELDTLIVAIGQKPDLSFLQGDYKFEISERNTLIVNPETLATNQPGIFAGGDCVTGPSTIADSIAQGKLAASSIHKYLRGESLTRKYEVTKPSIYVEPIKLTDKEMEEIVEWKRPKMPCIPVEERVHNFKDVVIGFSEEMAVDEAKRCLRCDLEEERG